MTTTVYTKDITVDSILQALNQQIAIKRNVIDVYPESRKGLIYKSGKFAKRTVNYFKRSESKAGILIATWVVESIAYALTFLVLLSSGAVITAALWSAVYVYISYAFFTMLKDAMVLNYAFKGV